MSVKLFFQRVALRAQGYEPIFKAGLLDPANGFEDYRREKDGNEATIHSGFITGGTSRIVYKPQPESNPS